MAWSRKRSAEESTSANERTGPGLIGAPKALAAALGALLGAAEGTATPAGSGLLGALFAWQPSTAASKATHADCENVRAMAPANSVVDLRGRAPPLHPFTPSPLHPFTPSPLPPFTPSPLHPSGVSKRVGCLEASRVSRSESGVPQRLTFGRA